jgi:hypothetical protein
VFRLETSLTDDHHFIYLAAYNDEQFKMWTDGVTLITRRLAESKEEEAYRRVAFTMNPKDEPKS